MSPLLRLLANSIKTVTAFIVCYMEYGWWEAVDILLTMEIQTRLQIFVHFNNVSAVENVVLVTYTV